MKNIAKPLAASILLITTSGCVASTAANPAPLAATPMSETEQLADSMVQADIAYRNGDTNALAPLVDGIAMASPKLLDGQSDDALAQWRERVPDTRAPMRGRALGPGYMRGVVDAGARKVTEQLLLSGETAAIAVGAAPKGRLQLRVFDADGKIMCERAPAHARDCRFVPIFTQRYRIELSNPGKEDARYYLVVD